MNMKTALALTALTAAGAASAAVTSANTLCRIQIDSTAKSTIVAVPLAKVGGGNIPVTELVLTDNLETNDTILHWNDTAWDAWIIAEDQGAKYWKPTVISEGSKNSLTAPAADTALARGDAIWVNRHTTTKPFYIYGQVATAGTLPAIVRPTAEGELAYTMMGNTALADTAISALGITGAKDGDKIVWANPASKTGVTQYEYKNSKWGSYKSTTKTVTIGGVDKTLISSEWTEVVDDDKIPAGQGFWYVAGK